MNYIIRKIENININSDEDVIRLFDKFVKENYGSCVCVNPETLRNENGEWYISVCVDSLYYEYKPNQMHSFLKIEPINLFYIKMFKAGDYLVIIGLNKEEFIKKFKLGMIMRYGEWDDEE
jgi:hypothetical protein